MDSQPFASAGFETRPAFPTWKRALDLGMVIATLPFWLAVMIFVTLWIKLVSPGPTFYKQERVGHRGRRFMILKFRSMRVNAETVSHEQYFQNLIKANTPMAKLDAAGDPRLIPGGRLIRALGLDELPQLLNVLRGDMSLVGPRPCTPKEFEHYDFWHQERVKAPPGLTGYWQVNGKNRTTFTEMIAMDIFYAEHMTLCLDVEIIVRTGAAVGAQVMEANLKPRFGFLIGKP
ncbi:MAG: sugar transferase [Chthoniobacteraceae bacterium]